MLSIEPHRTKIANEGLFSSVYQNMHFEIVAIGRGVIANIFGRTRTLFREKIQ